MSRSTFEVPFGRDPDGLLVPPGEATRDIPYACPACDTPLIYRSGPKKRTHFAHRADSECSGESIIHIVAKQWVAAAAVAALSGNARVNLTFSCDNCRENTSILLPTNRFDEVAIEKPVDSGRIIDVLLLREGAPALGIEVFVTHAVDEQKAIDLDFPWIEVSGRQVVDSPTDWRVRKHKMNISACAACRKRAFYEQQARDLMYSKVLRAAKVEVTAGYTVAIARCWHCGKPTPLFSWRGPMWGTEEPPDPIPRTVRFKYSGVVKHKYWANNCAHCNRLQGDFYRAAAVSEYECEVLAEAERLQDESDPEAAT